MTSNTAAGPRKELYQFNSDELRVLRECNQESFYYRSLPLGVALGALASYGVKSGYLKGSAKWGAIPKMLIGTTIGYFGGKISYQSKCAEKLMMLPNSPLAETLRQRRGGKLGVAPFQEAFSSEPINMAPSSPAESDSNSYLNAVQEMRREDSSYGAPPPSFGLNDSYRPSVDSFNVAEQPLPPPSPNTTSYDDLRRQNREEYERKRSENYARSSSPQTAPPSTPAPVYGARTVPTQSRSDKKNAYGDVWEE